jgi:antitoxin Phd
MIINTNSLISITEANQNFSKAVKSVDKNGHALILKNNKPRYLILDIAKNPILDLTDDEKIDIVAKRILEKYKPAFLELAK